jgi:hypothetical protein
MGIVSRTPPRRWSPSAASIPCWEPGRCAARSSATSRTSLAEKILFGELHPGEIVVVDVAPEGSELPFTFTGQPQAALPDHAPVELSGPDEQASA